ncbi:type III secretion system chaperone [Limnobacter parvus]|uniref:Type III secretion system chaperone n=1 Tax=Limnobacter parvus TaxID=2939690 RepID=A0ABT1XDY9_9BURK|nr:type III secretion system chaperone [Limnobacter parvus]MCR2745497.1 type III secretion system chaperone [Limnobacter parvus]
MSVLDDAGHKLFSRLLTQVGTAIGQPVLCNQTAFVLDDDARLELVPLALQKASASVLFVFTLTGFSVADAATLAQLLHLNRDLLRDNALPACFTLDESGFHVQFQQRMRLDEVPVWALQCYIEDSLGRLRDLFVLAAIPANRMN